MKTLYFITFIISFATSVYAQDPLKVGPDIYKLTFENDRVRAMEINFKPGDKIADHSHPDHLVYITSAGTLRIKKSDGTQTEVQGKVGDVLWIDAETHSAENIGKTDVKGLVIELKPGAGKKQ